jgi:hypothetical protein
LDAKIANDLFINPYIRVPAGGAFWTGFKAGSDDRGNWTVAKTDVIKWSIPIGLSVSF